jgi:DNA-binding CsgD family transcriptional regulator
MPTLRSPVLVGRGAELAMARQLLGRAARGDGRTLLVTGEAGIGKSRLLAEVRSAATTSGMAVLVGRALDGGGTFRPVAEALARPLRQHALLDAPAVAPYRTALARLVAATAEQPGPGPDDRRLDPTVVLGEGVLALLETLANVTGSRGCLLVLEDLHWADADSLDLVRYLADAVSGTPVLLAVTARDDVAVPGLASLAAAPAVTTLPLTRLDNAAVGALAAALRAGAPLPRAELEELVARSEGLPFLVEELLGANEAVSRVPPTLAGLVAGRLASLSDRDRQVLLAAATVGSDPDWRLLDAITGVGEEAVLAAVRAAADGGLLVAADGRLRWRHALTRDAVLATLLPPERAALAARAARALDRRGEPEDRAAAAALFVEAGERRRGAEILVELARVDVARGALRSAAELLERAAAAGHAVAAVAVERVRVLTLLGRAAEALDVGQAALVDGVALGDEHAELCLRLARAAVVAGRWSAANAFVERAGRPADARSMLIAANAANGAGDTGRARTLAREAVRAAERVGDGSAEDASTLCEALIVLGRSLFAVDQPASDAVLRRAAQIAAEHGLTPWRVEALFGLGSHEHTYGHPAAPSLATARELAWRAGLLTQVVQADLLRSDALLLVSGPRAALPVVREAADLAGRLRLSALQAMAELFAAADAALAGDLPAMTALLADATSRADAPAEVGGLGPMVRALPHLMRHDLPRASAMADEGIPALLSHGSAVPVEYFGLWALLRTAVADRDHEARETLRMHRVAVAAGNRAALGYADAIAAGREGRAAEAVACFADADAMLAQLPWWNRLLRLLALEAAVVDGWGEPVPEVRADLAAHEEAGEEQLAQTCRDLLRVAGVPTRRPRDGAPVPAALRARGITSREAEVLSLVASGLTNAQAAERLFLSRRTVDTHVARLLAKTGAADRTELRRWASSAEGAPR